MVIISSEWDDELDSVKYLGIDFRNIFIFFFKKTKRRHVYIIYLSKYVYIYSIDYGKRSSMFAM